MSGRNKLKKFAEVLAMANVYENFDAKNPAATKAEGEIIELKGHWSEKHFKNEAPITLELACGRGEYSLALADSFPERNFIGVDIKGARIWKGARQALEQKLANVAFLRTRIEQIEYFFGPDEVSEIWITFPDPFLRKSKSNRRLTSIPFLHRYTSFLKKGALLHLKTDNDLLYDFTLETIASHPSYDLVYNNADIYSEDLFLPELIHKTYYEKKHLENGLTIKYIQATYNPD